MISLLILFVACATPDQGIAISPTAGEASVSEDSAPQPVDTPVPLPAPSPTPTSTTVVPIAQNEPREDKYADVIRVNASGSDGFYSFSVTVRSPDMGCTQYADWWEVLTEDGDLIYRRVLAHSHTDEQPFKRSGEHFEVGATQMVIVRAHMNTSGYGGAAMKGSVANGFDVIDPDPQFAMNMAEQGPLPDGCAF